jgi:hypothetical protein
MSTSAAGFVMAEFLEPGGVSFPGYRMFGDDIALKALFGGTITDLSSLEGKPVRIRFTLKEAKLYSMQFTKEKS